MNTIKLTDAQRDMMMIVLEELIRDESNGNAKATFKAIHKKIIATRPQELPNVLSNDRPAYYDIEGGSMCNGLGRSYF